jgi:hypothetical protein
MPKRIIKLHVHSNNARNGVLNVKVTPWRVHLDANDSVEWQLSTSGGAHNDIVWYRVEMIDQVHPWPFQGAPPPDPAYTGNTSPGNGKVTTQARQAGTNNVGDVIRYGLTIGFNDDDGLLRTMYIDPDMVIDT